MPRTCSATTRDHRRELEAALRRYLDTVTQTKTPKVDATQD